MSDAPSPAGLDEKAVRLLEARAARLRARKIVAEEDGAWVAEFSVGDESYALPLERLVACLPLKGLSMVPHSRPDVVGITRWEGKVVAVFSMALRLGLKGWRRDPNVLLLLRGKEGIVGMDCEEIPRSWQLPFSVMTQAPAGGLLRPLALPASPGGQGSRLLQLIDPDLLFAAEARP